MRHLLLALLALVLSFAGCKCDRTSSSTSSERPKVAPNPAASLPKTNIGSTPSGSIVFVKLTASELSFGDTVVAPYKPGPDHGFAKEQKTHFTITALDKAARAHPNKSAVVLAEKTAKHQAVFEIVTTLLEAGLKEVRLGVTPDGTSIMSVPVTSPKPPPIASLLIDKSEMRVVSASPPCQAKDVAGAASCVKKLATMPREGETFAISARPETEYGAVIALLDAVYPSLAKLKLAYVCCVDTP